MANQRVAELFVESTIVQQPLTSNRVDVAEAAEPDASETAGDGVNAGSGAYFGGQDGKGLIWSIDAQEPNVLSLLQFSETEPVRNGALQLVFPSELLPHVALEMSGPQPYVYAVTARGILYAITLPGLQYHGRSLEGRQHSTLADMSADGSAVASTDLSNDLLRLGTPTVMVALEGILCMGCQNGSVLCIPQASLRAGTIEGASELKDTGGVGRLLTSLFARQSSPAVKDLAAVTVGGRRLLAAAYADGALRLWDLRRQACLLQEPLKPDSTTADAMAPTWLRFAAPPPREARRPGKIVVQFDRPDASGGRMDSHFAVFELNGDVSADGSSVSALSLQQVAILEPVSAASAATSAADLAVHQRPGGRVRAWALGRDGSAFAMDEAAVTRGVRGAKAHLVGDDVSALTSASDAQLQLQEGLWRSVTTQIEKSSGQALPPDLIARHFVGSLLTPGSFSTRALEAALAADGRTLALSDLTSRPVSELQQLTLEAVRERAADVGQFAAVHELLRSYWAALSAAQRPLGLLQGGPSAPSVIRGGPTLGLLRPAGAAAAHAAGLAVPGSPAPAQALQRVAAASGKLRNLLGPYVHSLVSQLLAEGLQVGQSIMPPLVHAIAVGPTSDAIMGGGRAGAQAHAQEVQRQWRRQRSRLVLEIGTLLEPIRSPEEVFLSYAGLLSVAHQPLRSEPAASQQALPAAGFLADVARDEAAAAAGAACDLLLLLAYLDNVRSLGSFPSRSGQSTAWQCTVADKAEAALRRAEIVRWLCTAPAAPRQAASGDPAALMHQLRLGRDSRTTALPPRHSTPQVHDRTLAEALLPLFAPGLAATAARGAGPAALGIIFASALMHGVANERGPDEAGLREQVMSIGRVLFTEKQLPQLLPLLQLAGSASDEPGLQFLKGYALLNALRSVSDPARRQRGLDEAAGPLFQAAADLAASAADATRDSFVRDLLGVLSTDLSGSFEPEGPEAERLQYYEALMLVCERLGCPEGAARFAQAAVRQVDVAYPPDGNAVADASTSAREVREGRLWSNLFVYSLDAGRYEAAYAAMHANPVPERQLDCLHRLLRELCARGAIASLVALPFAGTLDIGGTAILSLADEAARFLRRRADNAELGARPQPYQVLYDFCVARSDYRQAAAAQLALARRLRDEEPAAVDAVHAALSAALSALSLVEPAHAWLEDPAGADMALTQRVFHGSPLPNRFLPGTASPRSPLPGNLNEDPLAAAAAAGPALATPESLRRELALTRAISLAAKSGSGTAGAADRPGDVLQLLLANLHFEAAIRLAEALYSDAELAKWLERIVASLAGACVRLQQQEHQALASSSQATFLTAGTGGSMAEGEAQMTASAAWGALRRFLEGGPQGPSAGRLRAAAADAILAAEPRFRLPAWLLQLFQVEDASGGMAGSAADPAALLRIYMKRGRLEDAASLALTHLHAWQTQVTDVQRQRHGGVWFPHDLLGALHARLGSTASPAAARLRAQLGEALHAHYSAATQQSAILEQRSMALG